jgi:hypothetical protein
MIRRSLILWVALAGIVSVALFVVKYEVKALEEEFARLNRGIQRNREAIHVLRAEWSYLNRPDQLAEMALRHLDLHPLLAPQMGELAVLPHRKPEAGAADIAARPADEPAKPAPVPAKAAKPAPTPKLAPVLTSAKDAP